MPRRRRQQKQGGGGRLLLFVAGGVVVLGAGALALFAGRARPAPQPEPRRAPQKDKPVPTPPPPPVRTPDRYPPPAEPWKLALSFDDTEVYQSGRVVTWEGDLSTDADGSPRAYHPDDWGSLRVVGPTGEVERRQPKGLDAPENAVAKRIYMGIPDWRKVPRWAGIAVDKDGQPIIQNAGDPAPGYFVSTTALVDGRYPSGDPRRYVDSEQIPYLAIPPEVRDLGVKLGDLAAVEYGPRTVFAIVADVGPRQKIGEGSIRLNEQLGLPANPRGSARKPKRGIRTYVFLGSGDGKPKSETEIAALAAPLYERLRAGRNVA